MPLACLPPRDLAETWAEIDALTFTPAGSDAEMTRKQSLLVDQTDGIPILHRGHRASGGDHGGGGGLDDRTKIAEIIPEIGEIAFAAATVRQGMDITTDVRFSEDDPAPRADIRSYSAAAIPLPKPEG